MIRLRHPNHSTITEDGDKGGMSLGDCDPREERRMHYSAKSAVPPSARIAVPPTANSAVASYAASAHPQKTGVQISSSCSCSSIYYYYIENTIFLKLLQLITIIILKRVVNEATIQNKNKLRG